MKPNLNELARAICEMEGKKVELSIAQVKEVLACLGEILGALDPDELLPMLNKLVKW